MIQRERLYDPNNTTVIICSTDLERALDMKFLHVSEMADVVSNQMKLVFAVPTPLPNIVGVSATEKPNVHRDLNNNNQNDNSRDLESAPQNLANMQTPNIPGNGKPNVSTGNGTKFDIEGRYWVKPDFLKVLRQVEGVNPTQVVFFYREVIMFSD